MEKESKIKNFLKDKHNLIFVLILLGAVAIRLYFFSMTLNQALWWDESEYALKAKNIAFGTPLSGWAPEREIIVPLLFSLIFKIGLGETSLRLIQFLVSIATILMTYLTLSRLTDKKIGLISSFAMSFFWLHIFFSQRILLYLWVPLLYLIIIFLFNEGYLKDRKKYLYYFAIFSAVSLMTYFSVGFLLLGIFVYLLFLERFNLIKSKKAWKVFIIFLVSLLPFLIYFQFTYGFAIPRLAVGLRAATSEYGAGISGLFSYVAMFPSRVGWTFTILSLIGVLMFLSKLILEFGTKTIEKNKEWFLILISFLIPLTLYTIYGVVGGSATFYDAFILGIFPFMFAFSSYSIIKIYNFTKPYNKNLAIILVLIILGIHAYYGIVNSNYSIKGRLDSYDSVKDAGLWIKENSLPSDLVISQSLPQNTYYSERETIPLPENETVMIELINEKKPAYFIDSLWEPVPDWVHQVAQNNQNLFTPVKVYTFANDENSASLIVYKINY